MFNNEFLDQLPRDPIGAISNVIDLVFSNYAGITYEAREDEFEFLLEAYALVNVFYESSQLNYSITQPSVSGTEKDICKEILRYFRFLKTQFIIDARDLKLSQFSSKYSVRFGKVFVYEFSDGDYTKIQKLINELRNIVSSSKLFEEDHKARILARLEKTQRELHKKMSNMDNLWGLVGDAGVAIGKFGIDAKPIVDRIREIVNIVWRTQSRAEELPSDTPMEMIKNDNSD